MDAKKLQEIIESHGKWLRHEGGRRADLRRANLSGADLRRADLRRADLRRADLSGADLSGANLSGADLSGANLSGADLRRADLSGADLSGADLRSADLIGADLIGANLDFASMPLWCGDLTANYDDKQIIQQLYHVLSHAKHSTNASEEVKSVLLTSELIELAKKFHRAQECDKL